MVAVNKNPLEVVNTVTGEVTLASPYVGKRQYRDIGEFIKVYNPLMMMRMSKEEYRVFMYALCRLDFSGLFRFDTTDCMDSTGMSRSGVFRGLSGLLGMDAIRKDKRGLYWINPNIAFRGSRDELLEI
jgi:hypothetical protein